MIPGRGEPWSWGRFRQRCNPPPLLCRARTCYILGMTTAEDLEEAVEQLSSRELALFREWFEAFDAARSDAAIGRDARAGMLDALADKALGAHRAGRTREL